METKKINPAGIFGLVTGGLLLIYVIVDAWFINKIEDPGMAVLIALIAIFLSTRVHRTTDSKIQMKPKTRKILIWGLSAACAAGVVTALIFQYKLS